MKRLGKGCLISLLVIVIFLVGIRVALEIYVENIVNQQLALRLEPEASVGSISFALLRGKIAIKDFVIKEPLEGEQENCISIGELSASVSLRSLFSDMIVVRSVDIKDTHINIVTPQENVYNLMKIVPGSTNVVAIDDAVGVAVEDVEQIVTNEIEVVEEEIAKTPKAILIKKVQLENVNVTYKDYNISDPALFVGLTNINANVKNLTLNGEPDGKLHSSIDFTCEMNQNKNPGYIGIWAETAVIGSDGKIPAVNAIVAVTGLDLDSYKQLIPMGVTASLGGSLLDARVDASVEQNYLKVNAKIVSVSGKFEVSVGGTPDEPSLSMTDILTTLGMRGVMSLANPLVNVGDAGLKAGGAAVDTGAAVVTGAGKAVGNIGKGLFNTVKSTAKGDFKDAGGHLVKTGTGTIGDVASTVTDTAGTAAGGVMDSGGALMNKNSVDKWQKGVENRKDAVWGKAPEDLKNMPYPAPVK